MELAELRLKQAFKERFSRSFFKHVSAPDNEWFDAMQSASQDIKNIIHKHSSYTGRDDEVSFKQCL